MQDTPRAELAEPLRDGTTDPEHGGQVRAPPCRDGLVPRKPGAPADVHGRRHRLDDEREPCVRRSSSTGGVWYTGTDFPATYRNTYFHADYAGGWVKNMVFDDQNQLLQVRDFAPAGNGSVVAMATNP